MFIRTAYNKNRLTVSEVMEAGSNIQTQFVNSNKKTMLQYNVNTTPPPPLHSTPCPRKSKPKCFCHIFYKSWKIVTKVGT